MGCSQQRRVCYRTHLDPTLAAASSAAAAAAASTAASAIGVLPASLFLSNKHTWLQPSHTLLRCCTLPSPLPRHTNPPHAHIPHARSAIAEAVVRSLTLWQGPPGTGKTRTLLGLVEVLVRTALLQPDRHAAMGPILACADTNAAVDNLAEGLDGLGLRVVRVGQPAKVCC